MVIVNQKWHQTTTGPIPLTRIMNFAYLWNDIHFVSGAKTSPDVIISSAKSFGDIPNSSCRWKSIPDFCNSSIDSGAYISSLQDLTSTSEPMVAIEYVLDAEREVKLPCRHVLWVIPFLICQGKPDLNDLEEVDIAPHGLIMVVWRSLEGPNRSGNNAREFCILVLLLAQINAHNRRK